MLNELALSQKPKRQGRTTEVTGEDCRSSTGGRALSGDRDRSMLARTLRQTIRARQTIGLPWPNKPYRLTMTDERAVLDQPRYGQSTPLHPTVFRRPLRTYVVPTGLH